MTKIKTKDEDSEKPETKTYILDLQSGDVRKVTVPSTWTLTFGPTVPFMPKGGAYDGKTALRFYEGSGKDKLRACFTDVKAFRDTAIPIQERRTTVQRQVAQKMASDGMRNVDIEARVTEWVNPDEINNGEDPAKPVKPNQFLAMMASCKSAD